jgi:ParB family transcriptional regulator, chromosome partitioning protein
VSGRSRLDALQNLIADDAAFSSENTAIHEPLPSEPLQLGVVQLIRITEIVRSPFQPRSFFNPDKIEKMAASFRKYRNRNQHPKTAVLVRPHSDGYELVFGEQRKLAHEQAGYDTILAFVDDTISDDDARELALAENLLREDLNPIEKTEAILHLAAVRLQLSPIEVKQLLDRAAHERKQGTDNVIRTPAWQALLDLFDELPGRITPDSFRANYLPLLHLPSDVLEAIHEGKLEYTKARAIAAVKDSDARSELLYQAIENDWSIRAIRNQIQSVKSQSDVSRSDTLLKEIPVPKRISQLSQRITRSKVLSNPKTAKKIESLLREIELLVTEADKIAQNPDED